ncbi:MAG TPA: hypothetical protein VD969_16155 [Symbiobacteriaceae bacterium]|nr:hypothetical protein [Symbiobacteriaceae bacterium]
MQATSRKIDIWTPPGQEPSAGALGLAAAVGALGGAAAVARWQAVNPATALGYAHGVRHDLWWEFNLAASFEWQARVSRLHPIFWRQRLARLAGLFNLVPLLERPVESLTPAERARANLAVALLPQPDLLVWEEPFRALPGRERMQLCRIVRRLCRTEGLTVVMAVTLKEDGLDGREDESWIGHSYHGRRPGPARRRAAASGSLWP